MDAMQSVTSPMSIASFDTIGFDFVDLKTALLRSDAIFFTLVKKSLSW